MIDKNKINMIFKKKNPRLIGLNYETSNFVNHNNDNVPNQSITSRVDRRERMGAKGKRRREKNYRAAHGGYTGLPPPPDPSKLDALPSKLRQILSFTQPIQQQNGSSPSPFYLTLCVCVTFCFSVLC